MGTSNRIILQQIEQQRSLEKVLEEVLDNTKAIREAVETATGS